MIQTYSLFRQISSDFGCRFWGEKKNKIGIFSHHKCHWFRNIYFLVPLNYTIYFYVLYAHENFNSCDFVKNFDLICDGECHSSNYFIRNGFEYKNYINWKSRAIKNFWKRGFDTILLCIRHIKPCIFGSAQYYIPMKTKCGER